METQIINVGNELIISKIVSNGNYTFYPGAKLKVVEVTKYAIKFTPKQIDGDKIVILSFNKEKLLKHIEPINHLKIHYKKIN